MNVLVRTWLSLRRLASPNGVLLLVGVSGLLTLEVVGRQTTSDLHDLILMIALVPFGVLILARHRQGPIPGAATLGSWTVAGLALIRSYTFQMGLDFRGTPAVKRGAPPLIISLIVGLAITVALAGLFSARLPHGFRSFIAVSYVVYLGGIVGLWVLLAAAALFSAFVPFAFLHDLCVTRHRGPGRRSLRPEIALQVGWFAGLFALGAVAPVWLAPAFCAVTTLVYLVGVAPSRRFTVAFLWRPHDSIRVRSLAWPMWLAYEFLLISLILIALTLMACGGLVRGMDLAAAVMPVTSMLGLAVAWLAPGLLGLLCVQMLLSRWRDPSRPCRPRAHVALSAGARGPITELFRRRGWDVSWASEPAPLDVPVAVVAERLPGESSADRWPMRLTLPELDTEGTFVRLVRRDEIQKRRQFITVIEGLLKAGRRRTRSGAGFWMSPHYLFVAGLMRDSSPSEEGDFNFRDDPILVPIVGPPFSKVLARSVRRHLYDVLRGTQVDLIFLEDGVSFKRFRRVLRALFEVYDVHGGARAAEEIDFRGLPGIRCVIHEYQFDEPYQSNHYPEPKYDFLGRARLLHVFRDRGGDESLTESPFDFGRRPEPISSR